MGNYEWRSEYEGMGFGVPATDAEIQTIEREFDLPIPMTVRVGLKSDYAASIFKNGQPATHIVSGQAQSGGEALAYFQSIAMPGEIISSSRNIRDWVLHPEKSVFSQLLVISHGGGGEMLCLRYDVSGHPEPEVWWFDPRQETEADGLYKVADHFDEFIDKLITNEEYLELGFIL